LTTDRAGDVQVDAQRRDAGALRLALGRLAGPAGALGRDHGRRRYTDDEIFSAMLEAFTAAGGVATHKQFKAHFRYDAGVLSARGMNWLKALVACRDWTLVHAPGHPHLAALERRIAEKMPKEDRPAARAGSAGDGLLVRRPAKLGRIMGEVINFRGILHAPTNEHGVVAVFALLARDLEFLIETLGTAFPDCEAKRRVGNGSEWQRVRIEFEFLARNFAAHEHDPKGCDLIVCWKNDWPDCPLEVIALEPIVKKLARMEAERERT
jgi:hypothetical protein